MTRRMIPSMLLVGALALGACGADDDTTNKASQPTTTVAEESQSDSSDDGTALVTDDFEGVPLPADAEATKDPIQRSDFVIEYYAVDGMSPEEVLDFYTERLADDDRAEPVYAPRDAGGGAWRGLWVVDGQQLLVSAKDGDDGTEINLSLRDRPL